MIYFSTLKHSIKYSAASEQADHSPGAGNGNQVLSPVTLVPLISSSNTQAGGLLTRNCRTSTDSGPGSVEGTSVVVVVVVVVLVVVVLGVVVVVVVVVDGVVVVVDGVVLEVVVVGGVVVVVLAFLLELAPGLGRGLLTTLRVGFGFSVLDGDTGGDWFKSMCTVMDRSGSVVSETAGERNWVVWAKRMASS